MPRPKRAPRRVHWYLHNTGKVACGVVMNRLQWTWTDPHKVTCPECLAALTKIENAQPSRAASRGAVPTMEAGSLPRGPGLVLPGVGAEGHRQQDTAEAQADEARPAPFHSRTDED